MMELPRTPAQLIRYGLTITALGGLLFTFDLPLLRLAQSDKWTLVFARGIFLFLSISAVWLFLRGRGKNVGPYIAGGAGIAVIATNTLANISLIGATLETNAANVVFIIALVPILTALFSKIFINEQVHRYTWGATILALFGVAIIVWDSLVLGRVYGDVLAFICASCTAAAFTIIRWSKKNVATSLALGSLVSACIAAIFFPINLPSLLQTGGFGVAGFVWLGINGLLVIPLASTLIANGPRFLPSADVSMFFLLETVLAPVWIWLLFGEQPTRGVLVGGCIVITALLAHSVWRLTVTLQENPLTQSAK